MERKAKVGLSGFVNVQKNSIDNRQHGIFIVKSPSNVETKQCEVRKVDVRQRVRTIGGQTRRR